MKRLLYSLGYRNSMQFGKREFDIVFKSRMMIQEYSILWWIILVAAVGVSYILYCLLWLLIG
jgi:flagellar biosynthesis/type III secretory pathway M-ring protein FliF/YscJ